MARVGPQCHRNIYTYIAHLRQECHNSKSGIFNYRYRKNKTFADPLLNRCSVITQFAKLAAGEQLCPRCTYRKLQHFEDLKKKLSPKKKSHILSCDTVVEDERCIYILLNVDTFYLTYDTVHRRVGGREQNFWFYKGRGISWVTKWLLGS